MTKAKTVSALFFLLFFAPLLLADETLIRIIKGKKWLDLPPLFSDQSYTKLQAELAENEGISLLAISKTEILYKVKFAKYAEIGFISFQKQGDLYSGLAIENRFKPIHFIKGFRRLAVKDYSFRLGDAEIILRRGFIYQAFPEYRTGLLFYAGDWQFGILPSDAEEKLTLLRHTKSESFVKENVNGIFLLQDWKFLEGMPVDKEVSLLDTPELAPLFSFFQSYFGIKIDEFNEYWYLAIQESENVVVFEKDKKSFFFYDFNENSVPDTQLRSTADSRILLNYNAASRPKLSVSQADELKKVNLNLFYNPEKHFLSGTATLYFKNKLSFRTLNLQNDLTIHQAITADYRTVNLFRKGNVYFASSPESDTLSFFFNGSVRVDEDIPDLVRVLFDNNIEKLVDDYFLLTRNSYFYPSAGTSFFRSNLKISLPGKFTCLASGKEVSARNVMNRNLFHFSSDSTKGLALVCGDFKKKADIESKIPIRLYHPDDFRYRKYFSPDDIKECMDFLCACYGELSVPAVNLLVRRWREDGGISNNGFVVLNIFEPNLGIIDITTRAYVRDSPIVLSFNRTDYLLHELAHQWWGGQISWSNYRDEWITEGMAHFSTLLFLKDQISDSKFRGLTDKMLRWVMRFRDSGPIVYGKRIANLDQYEAFQSIIYLKSALVMLMLQDMVGQDELMTRLRSLLSIFKQRNVSTRDFINCISQSSPLIHRFLTQWIYSRKIPEVNYSILTSGSEIDIHVVQNDTDFVFPIWIEIFTEKGNALHMEIVEQKDQHIRLQAEGAVRKINLDSRYVPVLLKKDGGTG